jgi:hypothetical protein
MLGSCCRIAEIRCAESFLRRRSWSPLTSKRVASPSGVSPRLAGISFRDPGALFQPKAQLHD